ncbi:MAG: hypothetical protein E6K73_03710 [Candidatus Eisenbacteria bacterium]|uniref:Uncharacterized protein n=1 Tax=Eiseniibacteriota bacterium TaxID=2212470 RepID=A0A538SLA2_UNCEI|nr:MAG: hypothetical protein E6K73_03710 [Candidatus Eisenbacteria bacterium]
MVPESGAWKGPPPMVSWSMQEGAPEPSLGLKLSPSLSVMSVVLPAGVSPSSCVTNVRPVTWSVNRIGSPKTRGVLAVRSGFCSQVAFAGDWQSSKVTLTM